SARAKTPSGWKIRSQMTCQSTATSTCIRLLLLLDLQCELARLPLHEDLLNLPVQVERLDRVVDLEPERVALPRSDALRRRLQLLAGSLELALRRADVVEDGRSV